MEIKGWATKREQVTLEVDLYQLIKDIKEHLWKSLKIEVPDDCVVEIESDGSIVARWDIEWRTSHTYYEKVSTKITQEEYEKIKVVRDAIDALTRARQMIKKNSA